jgi:hypothetical protein
VLLGVLLLCGSPTVAAADHYALIVTGASGGTAYGQKYDRWRTSLVLTLNSDFGYPDDHLVVLAEGSQAGAREANRENVRAALDFLRRSTTIDDVVLVILVGHGTVFEGEDAKFNLVGPDLSLAEWEALIRPIPGRVVFVNTTSASFPFLKALARRGRIVMTATASPAQQFETIFAEFFIDAFEQRSADIDKNGRVSVWEAFQYASANVKLWYEEQGRLPTEQALLDDTGGGVGREATLPGPDGEVARTTYLQPDR